MHQNSTGSHNMHDQANQDGNNDDSEGKKQYSFKTRKAEKVVQQILGKGNDSISSMTNLIYEGTTGTNEMNSMAPNTKTGSGSNPMVKME